MKKKEIGEITHFFKKINVATLKLSVDVKIGDKISIEGHGNVLEQILDSMQIDKQVIQEAKAGQEIGLKVNESVKAGDKVFRLTE